VSGCSSSNSVTDELRRGKHHRLRAEVYMTQTLPIRRGGQLTPAERQHVKFLEVSISSSHLAFRCSLLGRSSAGHKAILLLSCRIPTDLVMSRLWRKSGKVKLHGADRRYQRSHLSFQTTFTSTANDTAWFIIHMPNANSAARNYTQLEAWRSLSPSPARLPPPHSPSQAPT